MRIALIISIFFLFSCHHFSSRSPASIDKNILIIGDSHMAGPFGQYLHQSVSTNAGVNVITYGHASSAPIHWLSQTRHRLSGGVFHQLSANRTINPNELIKFSNPDPTDWRTPVEVPFFERLTININLHEKWRDNGFADANYDYVVIELGANDRRAIVSNDRVNQAGYNQRLKLTKELALLATRNGEKCLWVGPPHGRTKTDFEQATLYKMLEEALEDTACKLISSNHFKAMGCDGVHFNCRDEMDNARKWSGEIYKVIQENFLN